MSTNKYSTYMPKLTQPVIHVGANSFIRTHFPGLLQWLSERLARRRKEKSHPILVADFALENERFAESGYYRVSPRQAAIEHMIELNWVNLRLKRNL